MKTEEYVNSFTLIKQAERLLCHLAVLRGTA